MIYILIFVAVIIVMIVFGVNAQNKLLAEQKKIRTAVITEGEKAGTEGRGLHTCPYEGHDPRNPNMPIGVAMFTCDENYDKRFWWILAYNSASRSSASNKPETVEAPKSSSHTPAPQTSSPKPTRIKSSPPPDADFLSTLSVDDRVLASSQAPHIYQAVIIPKRSGQLATISFAPGSQNDAMKKTMDLLWKLNVSELLRMEKSARFSDEADAASSLEEKLRLYQLATDTNPYNEVSAVSVGAALGKLGRLRECKAWLEKTAQLMPNSARVRRNLNEIREHMGESTVEHDTSFNDAVGKIVSIYSKHPDDRDLTWEESEELKRIGKMLDEKGGMQLMRAAHAEFSRYCTMRNIRDRSGYVSAPRALEYRWSGIGSWMG